MNLLVPQMMQDVMTKGKTPQQAGQDAAKKVNDMIAKQPLQPTLLFLSAYQLWFDGRRPEAVARFRLAREVTADHTFIDQFLAAAPALVVQK